MDAYKKAGIQPPVSWLVAGDGYSGGDMAWFSTISDSSSSSSADGGGGDGGGGGGGSSGAG